MGNNEKTKTEKTRTVEMCPVCMDPFHQPKLLPCCHTICQECLEHMVSNSNNKKLISCPICRQESWIPSGKVENFFTNYFISMHNESPVCDICLYKSSDKLIGCSYCGGQLCYSCYKRHDHNDKGHFARQESADDDGNDSLHSQMLRYMLQQLKGKTNTVYSAEMAYSFRSFTESSVCVNTMVPSSNNLWVVWGPHVTLYNSKGQMIHTKQMACNVKDISLWQHNSLLILFENYNSVMVYREPEIVEFVNFGNRSPSCMFTLENGTLVVAVSVETSTSDSESLLVVYNSEPRKLFEFGCNENGLSFSNIVSICANQSKGMICVADIGEEMLYLLREEKHPLKYKPNKELPIRDRGGTVSDPRYHGFKPTSICTDADGNIFIYDDASGLIHVVDCMAKLIGIVLTNDSALSGNPRCISMTLTGQLCLGDAVDGCVRVYDLFLCLNNLSSDDEDDVMESLRRSVIDHPDTNSGLERIVNLSSQLEVPPDVIADAVFSGNDRELV